MPSCSDCGAEYELTEEEAGYSDPPKRCSLCRAARKSVHAGSKNKAKKKKGGGTRRGGHKGGRRRGGGAAVGGGELEQPAAAEDPEACACSCCSCGKAFVPTAAEQAQALQSRQPVVRCKDCREARKAGKNAKNRRRYLLEHMDGVQWMGAVAASPEAHVHGGGGGDDADQPDHDAAQAASAGACAGTGTYTCPCAGACAGIGAAISDDEDDGGDPERARARDRDASGDGAELEAEDADADADVNSARSFASLDEFLLHVTDPAQVHCERGAGRTLGFGIFSFGGVVSRGDFDFERRRNRIVITSANKEAMYRAVFQGAQLGFPSGATCRVFFKARNRGLPYKRVWGVYLQGPSNVIKIARRSNLEVQLADGEGPEDRVEYM